MKSQSLILLAVLAAGVLASLVVKDPLKRFTIGRVPNPRKRGDTLPVVSIPKEEQGLIRA